MRPGAAAVLVLLWITVSPGAATAAEFGGDDAKLSLSGYLEGRAIYPFDSETPEEYPSCELGLEAKGSMSSWLSAKLFLQGIQDGKVLDPVNGRLFNEFDRIYQDKNPYVDIDEAYVDLYTGTIDLRIGVQKFAWGRLDEINPTDNLNTEDLTEGGTNDEVDRKIGVPAVKASFFSDLANLEVGWVPMYVPYRLPTAEERWFPGVLKPPAYVDGGSFVGDIPVYATYADMDMPPVNLSNSELGVRVSKYIAGCDVSVSYFTGYDMMPLMDAPSDVTVELADPLALDYDITAQVTMVPQIHRMSVYGADFTTTVSSFTVRGEIAYFRNKYYNRTLDSVLEEMLTREQQQEILQEFMEQYIASGGRDSVQTFRLYPQSALQMDSLKYGLGLDYIYGDTSVSVQCIQEFIPDYDEDNPVYFSKNGIDTLLTFQFKQFFLQNTMEFNLKTAYDIDFKDYIFKPSLKYSFTDNLQGTIGVLFIGGGDADSRFGQYADNDEAFARLRCTF